MRDPSSGPGDGGTRSVGYAVRRKRLPPNRLPPDPRWLGPNSAHLGRGAMASRANRPRRGIAPPVAERPRSSYRITTSPRPFYVVARACSRRRHASSSARLCRRARQARPINVIVPAVGFARGEERRNGDGPAGPAPLIEQNQPTAVTTRCGLRCSAGLRQPLDAVACLWIKSNSTVQGSARLAPARHLNMVLQA